MGLPRCRKPSEFEQVDAGSIPGVIIKKVLMTGRGSSLSRPLHVSDICWVSVLVPYWGGRVSLPTLLKMCSAGERVRVGQSLEWRLGGDRGAGPGWDGLLDGDCVYGECI